MIFNAHTYAQLAEIVFQPDYPGLVKYTEAPNGDVADVGKQYAHIAHRYMGYHGSALLGAAFDEAHGRCWHLCKGLGVPPQWLPDPRYGALRVLRYPPGVAGAGHTDYDLCTLQVYRNLPELLKPQVHWPLHWGELAGELGLGEPLYHWVESSDEWQYSILYAAMPALYRELPSGLTVKQWFAERSAKVRR